MSSSIATLPTLDPSLSKIALEDPALKENRHKTANESRKSQNDRKEKKKHKNKHKSVGRPKKTTLVLGKPEQVVRKPVFKVLSKEEEEKRLMRIQRQVEEEKEFLRVDPLTEKAQRIIEKKKQTLAKAH